MATYTYLPWVRQGLIGAVNADNISNGRIQLDVKANVTFAGGVEETKDPINILLFGPGDVTGFDARQVIRTDPPNLTSDFEPNYFPLVEFDRPDFPWLFSPETPNSKNQLNPWICLIAVEKREGVEVKFTEGQPLPVLTIPNKAHVELPDLSEAWVWTHAQIGAVSSKEEIENALKSQPERTLSRLMCSRRLKGKTAYFACVVPTYEAGVQAGLGNPVIAGARKHAWELTANPPNEIRLPVYYHWEFATGAQGDFEALVWQLERRQLSPAQVGTRKLDISQAGYGLPASEAVDLEGALGPETTSGDERVGPSVNYQMRLQVLLNDTARSSKPVLPPPIYGRWHAAQRAIPDVISSTQTKDRPWLRAINLDPRYRVAAGLGAQVVREQQEQLMSSAWDQVGDIERANQILRQAQLARAASARIHQERLGKLDATTFLTITGPVQSRVQYTAAQGGQTLTAYGHIQASALSEAATSAQFRRLLRPRGPIARRFGIAGANGGSEVLSNLNQRRISAAPDRWPRPAGMVVMENLIGQSPCRVNPEELLKALLASLPAEPIIAPLENVLLGFDRGRADFDTFSAEVRQQLEQAEKNLADAREQLIAFVTSPELVVSFYQTALSLLAEARWLIARVVRQFQSRPPKSIVLISGLMEKLPTEERLQRLLFGLVAVMRQSSVEPCDDPPTAPKPVLNLDELKTQVLGQLDPRVTIAARVGSLIQAPGWKSDDLDFVLAAPDFPAPMYKSLAELSQDWLLPGLEHVPPNTIALVESNPRFIEAFMVGLNHEMSRELLWRGFPTDQRGSYFRQFWDPAGRFPAPENEAQRQANAEKGKDIPPIHEWKDEKLGGSFGKPRNSSGTPPAQPTTSQLVLLIRGELLRRYPRAMIYAAKAAWDNATGKPNPTDVDRHPIFRGELAPDINFLGFDLDQDEARGTDNPNDNKAGWFIVIQQQPTEPRYGLDDTVATSKREDWTWRDLAWPHVKLTEDQGYVKLAPDGLKAEFPADAKKPKEWNWSAGADSAQIACITLQGPVRIAIHASDLL